MASWKRRRWLSLGRTILIYGALLLVVATAMSAWQLRDAPSGTAPAIQGNGLDGTAIDLTAYRGEPVLIYFWATWCTICKLEAPTINAIARNHNVLTVASWSGDAGEVAKHVESTDFGAPVLVDGDGQWAERYGVRAVPALFVVDGAGELRFATSGYTPGLGLRLRLWWAGLTGS